MLSLPLTYKQHRRVCPHIQLAVAVVELETERTNMIEDLKESRTELEAERRARLATDARVLAGIGS